MCEAHADCLKDIVSSEGPLESLFFKYYHDSNVVDEDKRRVLDLLLLEVGNRVIEYIAIRDAG